MAKTTVNAVDTWDLNEILAVLCQVARDTADAESVPDPQTEQKRRIACDSPAPVE